MKSANHGAYISQNSWGYIDLTTSVGADYKRNFLGLFFLRFAGFTASGFALARSGSLPFGGETGGLDSSGLGR